VKAPTRRGPGESFQARCADDTVFVLGDAFATEKLAALRAARNGFPEFMVQTALVRKGRHKGQGMLGERLEPNDGSRMTNDERNPKPEYRRALGCAIAGLVVRISVFLRISSFVIRHSDLGIAVHGEPSFDCSNALGP